MVISVDFISLILSVRNQHKSVRKRPQLARSLPQSVGRHLQPVRKRTQPLVNFHKYHVNSLELVGKVLGFPGNHANPLRNWHNPLSNQLMFYSKEFKRTRITFNFEVLLSFSLFFFVEKLRTSMQLFLFSRVLISNKLAYASDKHQLLPYSENGRSPS